MQHKEWEVHATRGMEWIAVRRPCSETREDPEYPHYPPYQRGGQWSELPRLCPLLLSLGRGRGVQSHGHGRGRIYEVFILCIYFSIMFICFKASSKSINLLFAIGGLYSVFIVGINHFSKQNRYPSSAQNHIKSLCWEKCFWDNFTRVCDDWVLTTSIILNNQWRHTELRDDVGCF